MEPSGADAVPAPKSMPAQSHLTPSGADALPVPMRASLRPAALKQAQRRRERNARRAASWRESRAEMPFLPRYRALLEEELAERGLPMDEEEMTATIRATIKADLERRRRLMLRASRWRADGS